MISFLQLKKRKEKEKEIRKNKRSKIKDGKNKVIFSFTTTDRKTFDFSDDIKLLNFAEGLYKGDLSFAEAEKEQEEMLKKSNELIRRSDPLTAGNRLSDENKNMMQILVKNSEEIYRLKNKIIDKIKREIKGETKSDSSKKDKKIEEFKLH